MRHVTILCNKNVSTPKSPNSTVQSPTDISWSGCLDIFKQQGSFPPSTGQLMALKELKGKQGEMMKWPQCDIFVRHHWNVIRLTSELDAERSKCTKWLESGELWRQSDDVSVMTYNKTALGYHHQSAHGQFTDSLQNIVSQNLKNNFDNRYNSFAISCKNVLDKIVPWKKNCARESHSPFMSKVLSKAIMVRTKNQEYLPEKQKQGK